MPLVFCWWCYPQGVRTLMIFPFGKIIGCGNFSQKRAFKKNCFCYLGNLFAVKNNKAPSPVTAADRAL